MRYPDVGNNATQEGCILLISFGFLRYPLFSFLRFPKECLYFLALKLITPSIVVDYLLYVLYVLLIPSYDEYNPICRFHTNKLSLANISQARILSAAISVQSGCDFRVNLVVVRIDWELIMMGRDGDLVADDRDDEIWDFTTRFLDAIGLEFYG